MLLNCHTYYSFGYGTLSVEALLDTVRQHGYDAFALTDINNTSACIETLRMAPEKGLKAVAGIDFRNGIRQQYVALARNPDGYRELNEHLSRFLHSGEELPPIAPAFEQAYVIYPMQAYQGWPLRENEFIGIAVQDLASASFTAAARYPSRWVALQPFTFTDQIHFNTHRLLRAIDTNTLLSKLPVSEQGDIRHSIRHRSWMEQQYAAYPALLHHTQRLLQDCQMTFEYGKLSNKNLKYYTRSYEEDTDLLRSLCMNGLPYRYPQAGPEVMNRIEKELEVITQLRFASYFLINWDITRYARHKNYYYVGRGSGANSILAYLLRITDVNPIELDLYFERFINLYRNNAPDFDIDFSWTDREDITRYIFDRWGTPRTALVGAYQTFQQDAAIRELGKVFGLPAAEIDRLQRRPDITNTDQWGAWVLRYANRIEGLPRHISPHASGILISEKSIHCYSATLLPPKGFPTTQFSMLEAEDIGLYKFDILSQRGLGKIKDTLSILKNNQGIRIDIHQVEAFKQDEEVKELLRHGKTIGCFYVESPAMRMLLTKLGADDYLRLVAASSIIRPGVSKSGMMREYILRYRHPHLREKARQALPELYALLEETYGVMVYQEDVIKIAHYFAGLSLAEADALRRGMSWKFKQRNEFMQVKEKFFSNCLTKGYTEKLTQEIWNQIESFANFAFSKGHSASYAVESYQAMYLKAHFPLEYLVATLNNGGGFYRPEFYVHEARLHGGQVEAPCINNSEDICVLHGRTIYLGLNRIQGLEQDKLRLIFDERNREGPYSDLYHFLQRIPLGLEQMRLLIRAGCFRFCGRPMRELLWEVHALLQPVKQQLAGAELFSIDAPQWQLPPLIYSEQEEAFEQIELLGFPLHSPFILLREAVPSDLKAQELKNRTGQEVSITAYLVHVKGTQTYKGERMQFGTFIDREGDWVDTVHFPPCARAYPFSGPGVYTITGVVEEEYDFIFINVSSLIRLPYIDRE